MVYDRLLTSLVRLFVLGQALVEVGRAFGMDETCVWLCLLWLWRYKLFLQLETYIEAALKLMKVVCHPESFRASVSVARHQAKAAIGGHTEAVRK